MRCLTCSAIIDRENADAHYEWHEIMEALIAKALRLAKGALA